MCGIRGKRYYRVVGMGLLAAWMLLSATSPARASSSPESFPPRAALLQWLRPALSWLVHLAQDPFSPPVPFLMPDKDGDEGGYIDPDG